MSSLIKIIYILIAVCLSFRLEAQTVKQISVAQNEPYTDHLSLMEGSDDMDLMVKFIFDEPTNTLTVSLISYKNLFVFQSDVRYSKIVRFRELKPELLPYVVETDKNAEYRITTSLRISLPGSKGQLFFNRWINYEGLQPQPTDYKMVNDYIEQKFDVLNKGTEVMVTLRDILMMELVSDKGKKKYDLFFKTDLDRTYVITIHRNPCFGKEEAVAMAEQQLKTIETAYQYLRQQYNKLAASYSNSGMQVFNDMQKLMSEQFALNQESNDCPTIQKFIDDYNNYVYNIQALTYEGRAVQEKEMATLQLSPDYILSSARKLDMMVARWQISTDEAERNDLVAGCEAIIDEMNTHCSEATILNDEQSHAMSLFQKAEKYFYSVCGIKKDR